VPLSPRSSRSRGSHAELASFHVADRLPRLCVGDGEPVTADTAKLIALGKRGGPYSHDERIEIIDGFPALADALEAAEARALTAEKRLHLILSTIYSTHGFLNSDGEIDTAAKFRAIERLARVDWDESGFSDVFPSTHPWAGQPLFAPPEEQS